MKTLIKFTAISCLLVLTGCASSIWKQIDEPNFVSAKDSYSVTLPSDWVDYAGARNAKVITKDGVSLQTIRINRENHKNAFKKIEKSSNANMLPQEVAENVIAEIKANYGLDNIEILSNDPALIGGQAGFKLFMEFKTERGLRRKYLAYGLVNDQGLYVLNYEAPTLHYFDRDVDVFESVVKSFALN